MGSLLDKAVKWARQAGELQRNNFRKEFKVESKKERINLVTSIDRKSEQIIIDNIHDQYPAHAICSEEAGEIEKSSAYRWIIDPLDGTNNYVHGLPMFAVSIALQKKGEIVLGVVYVPILDELYTAEKGQGAYLNGQRIYVSETEFLEEAMLATGFPYDRMSSSDNNLDNFNTMYMKIRGIRRIGSVAFELCSTAAGCLDGLWELKLNSWDIAAGGLIVKEAGGVMLNLSGEPISVEARSVVAGNSRLCDEIIETLNSDN